jgi:hypothetical protein
MSVPRELGFVLVAVVMAATGCAPMATTAAKPATAVPPAATTTGTPSAKVETTPSPAGVAIDTTTPSPAAERVLARIPEPLTPAQQSLAASADTTRARGMAVAPAAAYDSLQAAPVPAETQVLGTQTAPVTMGETAPAAAAAAPASAAASGAAASGAAGSGAAAGAAAATGAGAAAAATPASAESTATSPCWRLQVGAPLESEKDKADGRVEAAQSLLMVPFVIVPEKGFLKVRTRDCMTRDAADALKKRAVENGFDDAFLIDTSAPPAKPAAPAPKHARVPASKRKH